MASRRDIADRKSKLRKALREECSGNTRCGARLLSPVRELAERYQLSSLVVRQVLQELEIEGVLFTVARVGTFAGRQTTVSGTEFYLYEAPDWSFKKDSYFKDVRTAFEERVAQLGGATLLMPYDEYAIDPPTIDHLPPLAGILCMHDGESLLHNNPRYADVPVVRFDAPERLSSHIDVICFDNMEGGCQAARHLIGLGHRRIAFLALHSETQDGYLWSVERELGWRKALEEEGLSWDGLAYYCDRVRDMSGRKTQTEVARKAACSLIHRPDITAVVAANDHAAQGVLLALRGAPIPVADWPAIVGFDDNSVMAAHNLSSFRLPWNEVGCCAADILWKRHHGTMNDPPVNHRIPMRLIHRLTSRVSWSRSAGHAVVSAGVADLVV